MIYPTQKRPNNEKEGIFMAIEQLHTYCAMCTSHCGVIATVKDGVFTNVQPDPEHPK